MDVIDEGGAVVLVVDNSEHVNVGYRVTDDFAFGAETLNKHVFLLQFLGFLKLQFSRLLLHFLENVLRQFARVALQYLTRLGY